MKGDFAMKRRYLMLMLLCILTSLNVWALAEEGTLTLPKDAKVIGAYAFYYDRSFGSVVLPEGIEEIHNNAFTYSRLREINLPDSLRYIAEDAFSGTNDLEITAREGSYAYSWAVANGYIDSGSQTYGDYQYVVVNGECTILRYNGNADEIDIPSVIDGHPDTRIGRESFSCNNCSKITIPGSVTEIGSCAFEENNNLTEFTIPDGVTRIGSRAFYGCWYLENVSISKSVSYIGKDAFSSCRSLTSLSIDPANANFTVLDRIVYNKAMTEVLFAVPGQEHYTIAEGVRRIGDNAFDVCRLTSVTIPDGVTEIGDYAFFASYNLTEIALPDSVSSIGYSAFSQCDNLARVVLPRGISRIGDEVFADCYSLAEITIPDSVTVIGDYAFYNCESLADVEIPESVTAIGSNAFGGCAMTRITIPGSVATIGDRAFVGCRELTSVAIREGVTAIEESAFSFCDKLADINLPDSLTSIADDIFYCTDPTGVSVNKGSYAYGWAVENGYIIPPEKMYKYTILDGACTVNGYMGEENEIIIPAFLEDCPVTAIGDYAFYENTDLTTVVIPEGVTAIGDSAFSDCYDLIRVSIPGSLRSIGSYAFDECGSLAEIVIPNGVTFIGEWAFENRNGLTIYGVAGSRAESYAEEYYIPFSTEMPAA